MVIDMENIWVFIITLITPLIVIRTVIHKMTRSEQDITVTIQGARFHHLHLGILLVFASAVLFIFTDVNIFSLAFLGLGLGLILDEFIPSLIVPHQEPTSTKLYLSSLRGTIILFSAIIVILLAFYLIIKSELI
jgi:hypothetical protein